MTVCEIAGCVRQAEVLGRTICRTHYARIRAGSPLDVPIRAIRESRGVCIVDGCSELDKGPHGYCAMHKARFDRHGDPHKVIPQRASNNKWDKHPRWTGDDASYTAVHQRLKATRGPARNYACMDCGGAAMHWSYTHDDPQERSDSVGPYSVDLNRYVPRCVSCHARFDRGLSR